MASIVELESSKNASMETTIKKIEAIKQTLSELYID